MIENTNKLFFRDFCDGFFHSRESILPKIPKLIVPLKKVIESLATTHFIAHFLKINNSKIRVIICAKEPKNMIVNNFVISDKDKNTIKKQAYQGMINLEDTRIRLYGNSNKLRASTLEKIIKNKKKIGEKAEEVVLKLERQRLTNLNRKDLADRVKKISSTYCNAGYDIKSFNGYNSNKHDRFIEVKYSKNSIRFYISKSEIEKSIKLNDRYWLYIVHKEKDSSHFKIKKIKNLFKLIENGNIRVSPIQYKAFLNINSEKNYKKRSNVL